MTRQEAVQELQNCKGLIQQDGQDYLDDRDIPLLDMAIEALQKEVPKNPIVNLVSDAGGERRLDEVWIESALLCPVCHTWFGEVFDEGYCRKCGQKLIQKRVRVIEP